MAEPVVLDNTAPIVMEDPTVVSGNTKLDGEADTLPATPVPFSGITCGLVVELSVMVSVPVRAPACDGVKAIGIVQVAPAAILKQFPEPGEKIAKSLPEI